KSSETSGSSYFVLRTSCFGLRPKRRHYERRERFFAFWNHRGARRERHVVDISILLNPIRRRTTRAPRKQAAWPRQEREIVRHFNSDLVPPTQFQLACRS